MSIWLRTDEFEEATLSLEMVAETAPLIDKDISRWRWLIISLHGALQGFLVLALRGTNSLAVLKPKNEMEWIKAYEEGKTYSQGRMDNLLGLFEKISSDRMDMFVDSKRFISSETQFQSVKMLNGLRNDFIHFIPKGWSIEVSGMPQVSIDCLDIIEFLLHKSGNIYWYDDEIKTRAEEALYKARVALMSLEKSYEDKTNA